MIYKIVIRNVYEMTAEIQPVIFFNKEKAVEMCNSLKNSLQEGEDLVMYIEKKDSDLGAYRTINEIHF